MEDTQVTGNEAPAPADTVDTQANEANLQEVQTPEAAQTTEGQSAVNAEDTVSEKLYAGKYKSAEEMEKAYTELQSKYTNTSQEKAELSRILTEAFSTPEPAQVSAPVVDEYDEFSTTDAPQQQDTAVNRELSIVKFMMVHPDADAGTLNEVITKDPMIANINGYDAKLEYAYLRSRELQRDKQLADATKQATIQATQKTVEKTAAQVEQAERSEQPDPKQDRVQRMRAGDEAAIAEAINDIPAVQEMKRMAGLL